tara:strand:+ start:2608 stop:2874 length:267 start_codon:yes stop_codon:yes gene_type:complete
MSEIETIEQKQLIAKRVPPGDRWALSNEPNNILPSLTEALEEYFKQTKFNAAFYLDPLGGVLYAVDRIEVKKEPEPIQTFDFYGDNYQ